MEKEARRVVYDDELQIESYYFKGIAQPFPNHFHEHYVIGFIEDGQRKLSCKSKEYDLDKGSIVLFNPGDNHACIQSYEGTFDYRGFNISTAVMLDLSEEVTSKRELPRFSRNVILDEEVICSLRSLHEMVMKKTDDLGKEEVLLFLISTLIQKCGQPFENCVPECRGEIEKACEFIEQNYNDHIYLGQICEYAGLSKSTLLRAFTESKGVTPYRYLENIRINEARKLLSKGMAPLDVASQIGFSDQSHFSNYFSSFIGFAPGAYRGIFNGKRKGE